ncbi:hypothetical protein IFM89_008929 [Coptis chinensis]|uniref:RING-type E3 ubiquitin transferase n=1 Tax=Coptis chinensis TaxID=261450 RepID=A0A835H7A6_9MAGN|nr:hypothetical protein IFM89_008929 [Coptis chinensis]
MVSVAENITEARCNRRSRNNSVISPSPPSPQMPPLLQSTRCKPTISSLFLSTFTNNNNNTGTNESSSSSLKTNKKMNFTSSKFRGLGCTSSSAQVSGPGDVIRTSADWQAKKVRKKKQRNSHKKKNDNQQVNAGNLNNPTSVVVVPDVWCAPGIGFSTDAAAAASVDCVVSRRPVQGRGRNDGGERMNHRERSCAARRTANVEHVSILDSPEFGTSRFGSDVFRASHHRCRHHSPGRLAEIMLFQSGLMSGGRSDRHDRYRDWRLDVDHMSYEELLELGDRIGYEEYETGDELGKLECGHSYHMGCIKSGFFKRTLALSASVDGKFEGMEFSTIPV